MKKILVIAAIAGAFTACREKGTGSFTVSGNITNAPSKKVFLQELPFSGGQPVIIDSGSIDTKGEFTLKGMAAEEGLYRLYIENGPDVLIVNDNDKIRLTLDVNQYRSYKLDGSPASQSLHDLFEEYRIKDSTLYMTFAELDSLQKQNAGDSMISVVSAKRERQIKELNSSVTLFISKSQSPAAIYYVIGSMAARTMQNDQMKALINNSADRFTTHKGLAAFRSMIAAQSQKAAPAAYPLLGKQAPEISLPDVAGKTVSLSSFKGKYVLVDFWASWCGPCRKENPNVVTAYNQFKDKNFTILGVSLDSKKEDWVEAIAADNLAWPQISDLKYWNSSVVPQYGIDGIPFNVLVDPEGKIIASNLRGEELSRKLSEVLK